jgi:hypothetical protein
MLCHTQTTGRYSDNTDQAADAVPIEAMRAAPQRLLVYAADRRRILAAYRFMSLAAGWSLLTTAGKNFGPTSLCI